MTSRLQEKARSERSEKSRLLVREKRPWWILTALKAKGWASFLNSNMPGWGGAVGPDQAVGAEVLVVGHVAEVAAVGPVVLALGVGLLDAVVEPLPDEAALEAVVGLEGLEIFVEAAVAVAHGVGELAEDEGGGNPGWSWPIR